MELDRTCLLVKYNKVHNESLNILSKHFSLNKIEHKFVTIDYDLHNYNIIEDILSSCIPFKAIIIGDAFWPTGQNILKFCESKDITSCFLQHGQWIYIKNKKNLNFYPSITFLFGENVYNMCSQWEYSRHSQLIVTGSPRYDESNNKSVYKTDKRVFMSPPVIEEIVHNNPSNKKSLHNLLCIQNFSGIDKNINLTIQPHYRENRPDLLKQIFPNATIVDSKGSTISYIENSNYVLCSKNSTAVLDAISRHVPIILMNHIFDDNEFYPKNYFYPFAVEKNNRDDLIQYISENKYNEIENYEDKAKKHIYLGNASQRIVDIVKSVL